MSSLLKVLDNAAQQGSSGEGNSHLTAVSRCVRRERLSKEQKEWYSANEDDSSSLDNDSGVGKVFHGLNEVYFGRRENVVTEVTDVNLGDGAKEAVRLFREYASRFSPDDFAEIVGCEIQLPRNDEEKAFIEKVLGFPYTIRPDMVVRVEQKHCDILREKRRLELSPGYYGWDYKTMKAIDNNAELKYRHSPQFRSYMYMWNLLNPSMPVNGWVADCVVRHKKLEDKSFFSVVAPYPTEKQIEGWLRWARKQYNKKINEPDDYNLSACFDYFKPCPHLVNGACDQS